MSEQLFAKYDVKEEIGRGAFSLVKLGVNKETGTCWRGRIQFEFFAGLLKVFFFRGEGLVILIVLGFFSIFSYDGLQFAIKMIEKKLVDGCVSFYIVVVVFLISNYKKAISKESS